MRAEFIKEDSAYQYNNTTIPVAHEFENARYFELNGWKER